MRYIQKKQSHYQLERENVSYLSALNAGIVPNKPWKRFKKNKKKGTIQNCLDEQFDLCAYSEVVLSSFAYGMHLEHLVPKCVDKYRIFDHANIVLCAFDSRSLALIPREQVFGGQYRLDKYDAVLFVAPTRCDCRRFFHYRSDGIVEPSIGLNNLDREMARYTIDILNLNSMLLVNLRKNWIAELEEAIDNCLDNANALKNFAKLELCLTCDSLRPFHSAVRERFSSLGDEVISEYCPQCA